MGYGWSLDALLGSEQSQYASELYGSIAGDGTEDLRRFLDAYPHAATTGDEIYRCTPLHLAMHHRSHGVAALLLECGADPEAPDYRGVTPAHVALAECDLVALGLLAPHLHSFRAGVAELGAVVASCAPDGQRPLLGLLLHLWSSGLDFTRETGAAALLVHARRRNLNETAPLLAALLASPPPVSDKYTALQKLLLQIVREPAVALGDDELPAFELVLDQLAVFEDSHSLTDALIARGARGNRRALRELAALLRRGAPLDFTNALIGSDAMLTQCVCENVAKVSILFYRFAIYNYVGASLNVAMRDFVRRGMRAGPHEVRAAASLGNTTLVEMLVGPLTEEERAAALRGTEYDGGASLDDELAASMSHLRIGKRGAADRQAYSRKSQRMELS